MRALAIAALLFAALCGLVFCQAHAAPAPASLAQSLADVSASDIAAIGRAHTACERGNVVACAWVDAAVSRILR